MVDGGEVDRFSGLGLALIFFGGPFAIFSYLFLVNVPLTAVGIACVVLGATILFTPASPVPKGVIRSMVEESCINVEAVLEEFNAKEKATYLPPRENHVYAVIPLTNPHPDVEEMVKAPVRMITSINGKPALIVFPPGSELIRLAGLSSGSGLEDSLRHVLVDLLEGAESVKAVRGGGQVIVDVVNPRVKTEFPRYRRVLGSLTTSLAGCVLAVSLGVPVTFEGESVDDGGKRVRATFRVEDSG